MAERLNLKLRMNPAWPRGLSEECRPPEGSLQTDEEHANVCMDGLGKLRRKGSCSASAITFD